MGFALSAPVAAAVAATAAAMVAAEAPVLPGAVASSAAAAADVIAAQRAHRAPTWDEADGLKVEPLRMGKPMGGGGPCARDFECGWYHPTALAADRRMLPSGNGARCLVGRCMCASQFENKYGCEHCTLQLMPTFSYSDEGMELTTNVRTTSGVFDLCLLPVGGAPCRVGRCARDEKNNTIECPGDIDCDAAGQGGGICVGADDSIGQCVCGQGYFCKDCSLHQRDIEAGAVCEKYISGGALCQNDDDCGPAVAGYCARPRFHFHDSEFDSIFDRAANLLDHVSSVHPFCACEPGWACRRCERTFSQLESRTADCDCDEPVMEPSGGEYNNTELEVELTAMPWDSRYECEILYKVHRVRKFPIVPLWNTTEESLKALRNRGTRLRFHDDGSEKPLVLHYDLYDLDTEDSLGGGELPMGPRLEDRRVPQYFVIYAVTVPKDDTSFKIVSSPVVRSRLYRLNAARPARGHPAPAPLLLTAGAAVLWLSASAASACGE